MAVALPSMAGGGVSSFCCTALYLARTRFAAAIPYRDCDKSNKSRK